MDEHVGNGPMGLIAPAWYFAPQKRDVARAGWEMSAGFSGVFGDGAVAGLDNPATATMLLQVAGEFSDPATKARLWEAADDYIEPCWDTELGEFTLGFRLNEAHPRGQWNARTMAGWVCTEGAWGRLFNTPNLHKFNEPVISGVDFPRIAMSEAIWNGEVLRMAAHAQNRSVEGSETEVTITGLPSGGTWKVRHPDGRSTSVRSEGGVTRVRLRADNQAYDPAGSLEEPGDGLREAVRVAFVVPLQRNNRDWILFPPPGSPMLFDLVYTRITGEHSIDPTPFFGFQDPIASLSHLLGAVVFAVLGIALIQRGAGDRLRVAALVVYVAGVVVTLAASGLLHMATRETDARSFLLRADHASIFFLIAATYTPIHIIEFSGWMRWGVLGFIWVAAITGMILKIGFIDVIPEWISLTLYLALGWMGLFTAFALHQVVGLRPLVPIVVGALAYTAGALIDFTRTADLVPGILGSHEVFHLFVLAGVAAHWIYIRRITIYAPITDLYRT